MQKQADLKSYEIRMDLGVELNNLDEDVMSIFHSFSLPSWLSFDYGVRIISFRTDSPTPYYIVNIRKNRLETAKDLHLYIFLWQVDYDNFTIVHYVQNQPPPLRAINPVVVRFLKHAGGLIVKIEDRNGFFENMLDQPDRERSRQKPQLKKSNELQYRYIEPEDQRHQYESHYEHFHIAFQGGGAKGIAYIGAYKALLDLFPKCYIRSLIGSSAGGLISLAVSAGLPIEEILEVCLSLVSTAKDRVVRHPEDLTPQKRAFYDSVVNTIGKYLDDHGIISQGMFNLLRNDLMKEDVIHKLFEVACGDNETLKTMFSLEVPSTQKSKSSFFSMSSTRSTESLMSIPTETKLINYYGLLEGHLLSGDGIATISAVIIKKFLIGRFKSDPSSFCEILNLKENTDRQRILGEIDRLASRLNMHEYYLLTGRIQLTCTTVDVDDKILRCLNHKTTPYLPVCKAVQMTASYPIAFEAISWQKEWGRYYIHYANTRKEIDLTGHRFTDGGVLSNFPMKFLDNESVRPMYFSHTITSKTRIFGFGLEQVSQEEQQQSSNRNSEKMTELVDLIKKRLPLAKILYEQLFRTPAAKWIPVSLMTRLREIPILKFATELVEVLYYAVDNFVRECFGKDIYVLDTPITIGRFIMDQNNQEQLIRKHTDLRNSLGSLREEFESSIYECNNFMGHVKERCEELRKHPTLENLVYVRGLILNNLKNHGLFALKQRRYNCNIELVSSHGKQLNELEIRLSQLLRQTELINRYKVFRCDCIQTDLKNLMNIIESWEEQRNMTGVTNEKLKWALSVHFSDFFSYMRKNAVAEIDTLIEEIDSRLCLERSQLVQNLRRTQDNKLAEDLSRFSVQFPFKVLDSFKRVIASMNQLDDYILTQKQDFECHRSAVLDYVERMVSEGQSNNIHLVLESTSGLTAKYYLEVYRLINEYLFMNETKKTSYLIEKMTDLIIKNNSHREPNYQFGIVDLVKFIIVRSDIHKYVERNYENLIGEIDLGYDKYHISAQLEHTLKWMLAKRKADTARITSITCSATQCYLAFLFTLGLENTKILEEVDHVRSLLEVDYDKINRQFQNMDWALPFKCKVRDFEESMWKSRYDFFRQMEESLKRDQLETDMDRIKKQFEYEKQALLDNFHFIMDYVVREELRGQTSCKSFGQHLAEKMSLKHGKKNNRVINQKIGKDTKKALQLIYMQFQHLVRHIVFTFSRQENLEYLVHQKDPLKRQAIWKAIIMTNLISVDKVKSHIQDLLAQHNLPRDIRLKEYNEYCPVKIELTFTVLDMTSHCIDFINFHTYPQMPLWAAVLTGASHSSLFSPLRTKPSWSEKIDTNKELRHLKTFFHGDRWWNLPVFVSGSFLTQLPLEYLTNRKVRQVYYGGDRYTFLTFGVKPRPTDQRFQIENMFYRKFMDLGEIIKLALSIRGTEFSLVNKLQRNLFQTLLWSQDNLTFGIYYRELLRLPVTIGTLEFDKVAQPAVVSKLLEESYYYALEKFCVRKRTCMRVTLEDKTLTLRFISKQRNNKDLYRTYKVYYKIDQQEQEIYNQLIEIKDVNAIDSFALRFLYIDRRELGNKNGRYAVFENRYRVDITPFRYFASYEGLFAFPYSIVINGAVNPLKQPTFALKPQFQGSTIQYVFLCKSEVNIERTGLYCEKCSSPLQLQTAQQVCINEQLEELCIKCSDRRNIRFYCQQQYGACSARYCLKCCKSHVVVRCQEGIFCNKGHEYRFRNQTTYLLRSQENEYSKCDLCHQLTKSYFLDDTCNTTLCQPCSAEFAPQEFSH